MKWKHLKSGGVYEILAYALMEATLNPVIVYSKVDGDHSGPTWVRPVTEFMDGRFVPETSTSEEPSSEEERPPGSIPRMATKLDFGDTIYLDHTLEIPQEVRDAWNENITVSPTTDVIKQFESKEVVLLFHRNIFFPIKYLKKVQEP